MSFRIGAFAVDITLSGADIAFGNFDLYWRIGDEFTLCRGMKTLIHWRKVDALGGWVNCKGV